MQIALGHSQPCKPTNTFPVMAMLLWLGCCFQFAPPTLQLSSLVINQVSTYTFTANRQYDANLLVTPWNTQLVPANTSIDIYFPPEYLTLTGSSQTLSCDYVIINGQIAFGPFPILQAGSPASLVIKVTGVISTDTAISDIILNINGIQNPSPALATGFFIIQMGVDYSASSTTVTFQPAQLSACAITFNPAIVNTTGNMITNISMLNPLPRNGSIVVKFPASLRWTYDLSFNHPLPVIGTLSCSLLNTADLPYIQSISCIGSSDQGVVISIAYINNSSQQQIPAGTRISFSINNLFSPPTTEPADTLSISTTYPISTVVYTVDTCTSSITGLVAKPITVVYSSTVSPLYVNMATGFRVNFTLSDTLGPTDYFRLEFPTGLQITYSFKLSSLLLGTATYTSSNGSLVFQRSTASVADNFIGEMHYITFQTFTAPRSVRPTNPIRFVVLSSTGYEKLAGVNTIRAVQKTYSSTLAVSTNVVSSVSNYTISFTLADPLAANVMIILTVPNYIVVPSCPLLSPSSTITGNPSCTIGAISSPNYTITLTSINASSAGITAGQTIVITLSNITNYYSAITVPAIGIKIYYTNITADLVAVSTTNSITLTPRSAVIRSVSVSNGLVSTLQKPASYSITINFASAMPVGASLLLLQMDPTAKVDTLANGTINCIIQLLDGLNTSVVVSSSSGTITSAVTNSVSTMIKIVLPYNFTYSTQPVRLLNIILPVSLYLRSPATTRPIWIRISSYDSNHTNANIIDQGVNYTADNMFTPMALSKFTLSRAITANMAVTNYTFVIWITGDTLSSDYIPNSVAVIVVPTQISIDPQTKCYSSMSVDLSCIIVNQTLTIPMDTIFNFRIGVPTIASNIFQFVFVVSKLKNPISLRPSSLFSGTVQTANSSGAYVYATDNSTLVVQNNMTVEFNNISYLWSNYAYGGTTTQLNISLSSLVSGVAQINVDASRFSLTIGNTTGTYNYSDCSSLESSLQCQIVITSTSKIIQIYPILSGVRTVFTSAITVSISNLFMTPMAPSTNATNLYLVPVSGLDASGYAVYSSASSVQFSSMCSLPCATCPSRAQSSVCLSCYTDANISSLKYLYAGQCYLQCPLGTLYVNSTNSSYTYTCLSCSSNCSQCINALDYCTYCPNNYSLYRYSNNGSNYSVCVSQCPNHTYAASIVDSTNVTISQCLPCLSPCFDCTSNVTCVSCLPLFYQFTNISALECLSQCPIDITVANITSMICQYCSAPCLLCIGAVSNCTTCISNYYQISNQLLSQLNNNVSISQGYTCLSTCPGRTISIGTICQLCATPCLTCNNSLTQCTSCVAGYLISSHNNTSCVNTCQQYSFPNSTSGNCQLCSTIPALNCLDCSSALQCNQCDDPAKPGYIYFPTNRSCLSTLPDGYINNSGIAQPCLNSCSLCSIVVDNCTLCLHSNLFWNLTTNSGICMNTCPSTYTNMSNICLKCMSPCLQCIGNLTNCTSCQSQFYVFNGACIDGFQCPLYYYLNESTRSCSHCSSPCSVCINYTFCLLCSNGYLFQSTGECLLNCPVGFAGLVTTRVLNSTLFSNVMICLACLSPCLTCNTLRENCTSCISSFYFYPELNRCFLPCPANISIGTSINSTLMCISCTPPCRTCVNNTSTCLSCVQNYYLETSTSTCGISCIDGKYPANGLCNLCVTPCLTCTSSVLCLTCVTGTYYLDASCLTVCPVNMAIIVSGACTSCEPGCTNCSSANSYDSSTCYYCVNPYALYNSHCYSSCPNTLIMYMNASENKYYCLTSQQYADAQLGVTLSLDPSNILPMPFSVIAAFLFIATFMSRLQSRGTYVIGVLYCWLGILQAAVLAYFLFGVYSKLDTNNQRIWQYKQQTFMFGLIALFIIGGLNVLALLFHTCFLWSDKKFKSWANQSGRKNDVKNINKEALDNLMSSEQASDDNQKVENAECCSHKSTFVFITLTSLVTSYKLKILLFTGLFRFTGLSFPMDSVHKFRVFNVFSFLGMLQEGFTMYFIYLVAKQGISYADNKLLFLQVIDLAIIYALNVILAFLILKKDDDFFESLLCELDQEEQQNLRKIKAQQNERLIQQSKQTAINKKPNTLRPDMIGMDSFHSLKNAAHEQQQIQVNYHEQIEHAQIQRTQINKVGSQNRGLQQNQQSFEQASNGNQNHLKLTSRLDQHVNHNINTAYRTNWAKTGQWVEIDDNKFQPNNLNENRSFNDETVSNIYVARQSNISNHNNTVNANKSPARVRVDQQIYATGPISNTAYENILYKKSKQVSQHNKTSKLARVSEQVSQKQAPKLNSAAMLLSSNKQQNVDISFDPVLPFVHEQGELKYIQRSPKKLNNSKNIVERNIFELDNHSMQDNPLDQPQLEDEINETNLYNVNDKVSNIIVRSNRSPQELRKQQRQIAQAQVQKQQISKIRHKYQLNYQSCIKSEQDDSNISKKLKIQQEHDKKQIKKQQSAKLNQQKASSLKQLMINATQNQQNHKQTSVHQVQVDNIEKRVFADIQQTIEHKQSIVNDQSQRSISEMTKQKNKIKRHIQDFNEQQIQDKIVSNVNQMTKIDNKPQQINKFYTFQERKLIKQSEDPLDLVDNRIHQRESQLQQIRVKVSNSASKLSRAKRSRQNLKVTKRQQKQELKMKQMRKQSQLQNNQMNKFKSQEIQVQDVNQNVKIQQQASKHQHSYILQSIQKKSDIQQSYSQPKQIAVPQINDQFSSNKEKQIKQQLENSKKQMANIVENMHPSFRQNKDAKMDNSYMNQNIQNVEHMQNLDPLDLPQKNKKVHASLMQNKQNVFENICENRSHKLLQFDESSLKRDKFEFQQESQEKLSNPFDGSVNEQNSDMLKQLHDQQDSQDSSKISANQQLFHEHAQTLSRTRNDDTVPLTTPYQAMKYNPITEQNSEMEVSQRNTLERENNPIFNQQIQDLDTSNQQGIAKRQHQQPNEKQIIRALNLAHKKKQLQNGSGIKRRLIPQSDRPVHSNQILPNFKAPVEHVLRDQNLFKKKSLKYPLNNSQAERNTQTPVQSLYEEQISQIQSRKNNNKTRNTRAQPHLKQQIMEQSFDRKNAERVDMNQQYVKIFVNQNDSYADLLEWKQKFTASVTHHTRELIEAPEKPKVGLINYDDRQNDEPLNFEYQETEPYHRGNLFMFEQSFNNFEHQSQQRSSSKPKSRSKQKQKNPKRYGKQSRSKQKESRSSLEKIYLQKLNNK